MFIKKIMMSHSVCLNIGLIFRALSKKDPIGKNPSSQFKHTSQLIYTLFFKKLIRKKKKRVGMGLESRLSVLIDAHGPPILIETALRTKTLLDSIFCFIIVCGLFSLSNKGIHTLVRS